MPLDPTSLKWRVLIGCFVGYIFGAMDIIVLAISMPAIMASLHITQSQAGLLATDTLIGVGLGGIVLGRLSAAVVALLPRNAADTDRNAGGKLALTSGDSPPHPRRTLNWHVPRTCSARSIPS